MQSKIIFAVTIHGLSIKQAVFSALGYLLLEASNVKKMLRDIKPRSMRLKYRLKERIQCVPYGLVATKNASKKTDSSLTFKMTAYSLV